MLLFWGGGWEDRENNGEYSVNNTDRYNITYRGRRRRSYFQIRGGGGALFDAVGRNNGCVDRGAVVSGEVGRITGCRCHLFCLIGVQGETRYYESVCPPELRGQHNLVEVEIEAKRVVVVNCEELKRREDK